MDPHDLTLNLDGTHDNETPKLYQNLFSLTHPQSLAFIGIALMLFPAFLMAGLSSMALAQLRSSHTLSPAIPPQTAVNDGYADHLHRVRSIRATSPHGKFIKLSVKNGPWLEFVQGAAEMGIVEYLGWESWRAWKLYFTDN